MKKKIIAVVALLVLFLAGVRLRTFITVDMKPYTILTDNWEAVAVIQMNCIKDIDENITLSIDRKGKTGNAVYKDETSTIEYTWEYTGLNIDFMSYQYQLTAANATAGIYADNKEGLIFCQSNDAGDIRGIIFVKSGTTDNYDKYTDFEDLLSLDLKNEVISYMDDEEAISLIEGIWEGSRYEVGGNTSLLAPNAVSLAINGNSYEVMMVDEIITGQFSYTRMSEGLYFYDLDSGYEDCILAYDEESGSVVLYEEESDIGIVFKKI